AAAMVDARRGEAGLERRLRAVALTDRPERGGVGAVRGEGEERLGRRTLDGAEDLHLVAHLLAALEVEGHLALGDHGGGFDHVVGEGDAIPVEELFHRATGRYERRSPARRSAVARQVVERSNMAIASPSRRSASHCWRATRSTAGQLHGRGSSARAAARITISPVSGSIASPRNGSSSA